jgi:hypothetical protein
MTITQRARTSLIRRRAAAASFVAAGLVALTGANGTRSIVDLQPFRTAQTIAIQSPRGNETATLINLNPAIGAWYILTIGPKSGAPGRAYHLENPRPFTQTIVIDPRYAEGLVITEGTRRFECDLFSGSAPIRLESAALSRAVFQPLCEGRVYVRNRASGRHTRLESATDLMRERLWGGEKLLGLGHQIMGDRNVDSGTVKRGGAGHPASTGPLPALVSPDAAGKTLISANLGISVVGAGKGLTPGAWYAATGYPGVFVSMLQPGMVAASILRGRESAVSALDSVESSALCYLVAFNMDLFDLGYAGGTEHPAVDWSAHMPSRMRDPQLPGPDGIGTIAPLVATGLVSPDDAPRTIATFTGGFKRTHGAFLYGDFSTRNHATHYGFIESGVVLSTLQPGLATLLVTADGRVDMKTWNDADNAGVKQLRHARQNGVPIVEYDEQTHTTVPGRLVNRWGPGNWSGSQDMKLRTIRAGAAIQTNGAQRYLIYAVFSSATPSAMARVFQAYRSRYAMQLDMNALEHTYFAIQRREASGIRLEYLIKGMSQVDRTSGGRIVPRFVEAPDNRDFFYVMRRGEGTHP